MLGATSRKDTRMMNAVPMFCICSVLERPSLSRYGLISHTWPIPQAQHTSCHIDNSPWPHVCLLFICIYTYRQRRQTHTQFAFIIIQLHHLPPYVRFVFRQGGTHPPVKVHVRPQNNLRPFHRELQLRHHCGERSFMGIGGDGGG